MDMEQGSFILVSTIEELLGRSSSCSGKETEVTAVEILRANNGTPSIHNS
jgi:hypothetical protein